MLEIGNLGGCGNMKKREKQESENRKQHGSGHDGILREHFSYST
jgi:hypothetical protein